MIFFVDISCSLVDNFAQMSPQLGYFRFKIDEVLVKITLSEKWQKNCMRAYSKNKKQNIYITHYIFTYMHNPDIKYPLFEN